MSHASCQVMFHFLLSTFPAETRRERLLWRRSATARNSLGWWWDDYVFLLYNLFDEDGDANDDDLLVSCNNCVPCLFFFSWCSFDFTVGMGIWERESILMYLFTINCTIALLGKQNMIINNKGHQRASIQEQQKGRLKRKISLNMCNGHKMTAMPSPSLYTF